MTDNDSERNVRRPDCPFCGADWTDEMMAQLEQATVASSCACCAGPVHEAPAAPVAAPAPLPTRDISCASCGKPIYRAVSAPEALA